MKPYPIKCNPILKHKVWGGEKLKTQLAKTTQAGKLGESWEISAVPGHVSQINNGPYSGWTLEGLQQEFKESFLGTDNYRVFGDTFPLLIKYLDAQTNLSVQVHPDDRLARAQHNSPGKTEMWYIMETDEDASIYLGLQEDETDVATMNHMDTDNVASILNKRKVNPGESFYVPAGEVHAIGAGVMLAEIQQTSDVTYRIYDWEVVDAQGQPRELHMEQAVEAIQSAVRPENRVNAQTACSNSKEQTLAACPYFTTRSLQVQSHQHRDLSEIDSFVIYMCVGGSALVQCGGFTEQLHYGETVLIPANARSVYFHTEKAQLLEIHIEPELLATAA